MSPVLWVLDSSTENVEYLACIRRHSVFELTVKKEALICI